LIDKLSQQAGTKSGFHWAALGREAGVCFCAVPFGLSFLAGALDAEVRQRAKPKKRAKKADDGPKEKVEETRPEEVINNKSDGDKLSAMEKLNRKVKSRLESRSKEEIAKGIADPKLDAVRFLFNPKSFTQTVENIFTYSFLIKKGNAAIGVRADHDDNNNGGDKSLFVEWTKAETVNGPARQSVCSFTMADFRRLTEGVDEYDMPNRSSRAT
jgi:non-structural maintenance of chromosomes element 4